MFACDVHLVDRLCRLSVLDPGILLYHRRVTGRGIAVAAVEACISKYTFV